MRSQIVKERGGVRELDGLLLLAGQDGRLHCEDVLVGVAHEAVSCVAQARVVESVDASGVCIYLRELVVLEVVYLAGHQVLRGDVEDAHILVSRHLTRVLERKVPLVLRNV